MQELKNKINDVQNALTGLIGTIEQLEDRLENIGDNNNLSEKLSKIGNTASVIVSAADAVDRLVQGLTSLEGAGNNAGTESLVQHFEKLASSSKELSASFLSQQENLNKLANANNKYARSINSVKSALEGISDSRIDLSGFDRLSGKIAGVASLFGDLKASSSSFSTSLASFSSTVDSMLNTGSIRDFRNEINSLSNVTSNIKDIHITATFDSSQFINSLRESINVISLLKAQADALDERLRALNSRNITGSNAENIPVAPPKIGPAPTIPTQATVDEEKAKKTRRTKSSAPSAPPSTPSAGTTSTVESTPVRDASKQQPLPTTPPTPTKPTTLAPVSTSKLESRAAMSNEELSKLMTRLQDIMELRTEAAKRVSSEIEVDVGEREIAESIQDLLGEMANKIANVFDDIPNSLRSELKDKLSSVLSGTDVKVDNAFIDQVVYNYIERVDAYLEQNMKAIKMAVNKRRTAFGESKVQGIKDATSGALYEAATQIPKRGGGSETPDSHTSRISNIREQADRHTSRVESIEGASGDSGSVTGKISNMFKTLKQIPGNIREFSNEFTGSIKEFSNDIRDVKGVSLSEINDNLSKLAFEFKRMGENISQIYSSLEFSKVKTPNSANLELNFADIFTHYVNEIVKGITKIPKFINSSLEQVIMNQASNMEFGDAVNSAVRSSGIAQRVEGTVQSFSTSVTDVFSATKDLIKRNFDKINNDIKQLISEVDSEGKYTIQQMRDSVKDMFEEISFLFENISKLYVYYSSQLPSSTKKGESSSVRDKIKGFLIQSVTTIKETADLIADFTSSINAHINFENVVEDKRFKDVDAVKKTVKKYIDGQIKNIIKASNYTRSEIIDSFSKLNSEIGLFYRSIGDAFDAFKTAYDTNIPTSQPKIKVDDPKLSFTQILAKVVNKVKESSDSISRVLLEINDYFNNIILAINGLDVKSSISTVISSSERFGSEIKRMVSNINNMMDTIKQSLSSKETSQPAVQGPMDFSQGLSALIDHISKSIELAAKVPSKLSDIIERIIKDHSSGISFKDSIFNMIKDSELTKSIESLYTKVRVSIQAQLYNIALKVNMLYSDIKSKLVSKVQGYISDIESRGKSTLGELKSSFEALFSEVAWLFSNVKELYNHYFNKVPDSSGVSATGMSDKIKNLMSKVIDTTKEVTDSITIMVNSVNEAINPSKIKADPRVNSISAIKETMIGYAKSSVSELVNNIRESIKAYIDTIALYFGNIKQSIISKASEGIDSVMSHSRHTISELESSFGLLSRELSSFYSKIGELFKSVSSRMPKSELESPKGAGNNIQAVIAQIVDFSKDATDSISQLMMRINSSMDSIIRVVREYSFDDIKAAAQATFMDKSGILSALHEIEENSRYSFAQIKDIFNEFSEEFSKFYKDVSELYRTHGHLLKSQTINDSGAKESSGKVYDIIANVLEMVTDFVKRSSDSLKKANIYLDRIKSDPVLSDPDALKSSIDSFVSMINSMSNISEKMDQIKDIKKSKGSFSQKWLDKTDAIRDMISEFSSAIDGMQGSLDLINGITFVRTGEYKISTNIVKPVLEKISSSVDSLSQYMDYYGDFVFHFNETMKKLFSFRPTGLVGIGENIKDMQSSYEDLSDALKNNKQRSSNAQIPMPDFSGFVKFFADFGDSFEQLKVGLNNVSNLSIDSGVLSRSIASIDEIVSFFNKISQSASSVRLDVGLNIAPLKSLSEGLEGIGSAFSSLKSGIQGLKGFTDTLGDFGSHIGDIASTVKNLIDSDLSKSIVTLDFKSVGSTMGDFNSRLDELKGAMNSITVFFIELHEKSSKGNFARAAADFSNELTTAVELISDAFNYIERLFGSEPNKGPNISFRRESTDGIEEIKDSQGGRLSQLSGRFKELSQNLSSVFDVSSHFSKIKEEIDGIFGKINSDLSRIKRIVESISEILDKFAKRDGSLGTDAAVAVKEIFALLNKEFPGAISSIKSEINELYDVIIDRDLPKFMEESRHSLLRYLEAINHLIAFKGVNRLDPSGRKLHNLSPYDDVPDADMSKVKTSHDGNLIISDPSKKHRGDIEQQKLALSALSNALSETRAVVISSSFDALEKQSFYDKESGNEVPVGHTFIAFTDESGSMESLHSAPGVRLDSKTWRNNRDSSDIYDNLPTLTNFAMVPIKAPELLVTKAIAEMSINSGPESKYSFTASVGDTCSSSVAKSLDSAGITNNLNRVLLGQNLTNPASIIRDLVMQLENRGDKKGTISEKTALSDYERFYRERTRLANSIESDPYEMNREFVSREAAIYDMLSEFDSSVANKIRRARESGDQSDPHYIDGVGSNTASFIADNFPFIRNFVFDSKATSKDFSSSSFFKNIGSKLQGNEHEEEILGELKQVIKRVALLISKDGSIGAMSGAKEIHATRKELNSDMNLFYPDIKSIKGIDTYLSALEKEFGSRIDFQSIRGSINEELQSNKSEEASEPTARKEMYRDITESALARSGTKGFSESLIGVNNTYMVIFHHLTDFEKRASRLLQEIIKISLPKDSLLNSRLSGLDRLMFINQPGSLSRLLKGMGVDIDREDLRETPSRLIESTGGMTVSMYGDEGRSMHSIPYVSISSQEVDSLSKGRNKGINVSGRLLNHAIHELTHTITNSLFDTPNGLGGGVGGLFSNSVTPNSQMNIYEELSKMSDILGYTSGMLVRNSGLPFGGYSGIERHKDYYFSPEEMFSNIAPALSIDNSLYRANTTMTYGEKLVRHVYDIFSEIDPSVFKSTQSGKINNPLYQDSNDMVQEINSGIIDPIMSDIRNGRDIPSSHRARLEMDKPSDIVGDFISGLMDVKGKSKGSDSSSTSYGDLYREAENRVSLNREDADSSHKRVFESLSLKEKEATAEMVKALKNSLPSESVMNSFMSGIDRLLIISQSSSYLALKNEMDPNSSFRNNLLAPLIFEQTLGEASYRKYKRGETAAFCTPSVNYNMAAKSSGTSREIASSMLNTILHEMTHAVTQPTFGFEAEYGRRNNNKLDISDDFGFNFEEALRRRKSQALSIDLELLNRGNTAAESVRYGYGSVNKQKDYYFSPQETLSNISAYLMSNDQSFKESTRIIYGDELIKQVSRLFNSIDPKTFPMDRESPVVGEFDRLVDILEKLLIKMDPGIKEYDQASDPTHRFGLDSVKDKLNGAIGDFVSSVSDVKGKGGKGTSLAHTQDSTSYDPNGEDGVRDYYRKKYQAGIDRVMAEGMGGGVDIDVTMKLMESKLTPLERQISEELRSMISDIFPDSSAYKSKVSGLDRIMAVNNPNSIANSMMHLDPLGSHSYGQALNSIFGIYAMSPTSNSHAGVPFVSFTDNVLNRSNASKSDIAAQILETTIHEMTHGITQTMMNFPSTKLRKRLNPEDYPDMGVGFDEFDFIEELKKRRDVAPITAAKSFWGIIKRGFEGEDEGHIGTDSLGLEGLFNKKYIYSPDEAFSNIVPALLSGDKVHRANVEETYGKGIVEQVHKVMNAIDPETFPLDRESPVTEKFQELISRMIRLLDRIDKIEGFSELAPSEPTHRFDIVGKVTSIRSAFEDVISDAIGSIAEKKGKDQGDSFLRSDTEVNESVDYRGMYDENTQKLSDNGLIFAEGLDRQIKSEMGNLEVMVSDRFVSEMRSILPEDSILRGISNGLDRLSIISSPESYSKAMQHFGGGPLSKIRFESTLGNYQYASSESMKPSVVGFPFVNVSYKSLMDSYDSRGDFDINGLARRLIQTAIHEIMHGVTLNTFGMDADRGRKLDVGGQSFSFYDELEKRKSISSSIDQKLSKMNLSSIDRTRFSNIEERKDYYFSPDEMVSNIAPYLATGDEELGGVLRAVYGEKLIEQTSGMLNQLDSSTFPKDEGGPLSRNYEKLINVTERLIKSLYDTSGVNITDDGMSATGISQRRVVTHYDPEGTYREGRGVGVSKIQGVVDFLSDLSVKGREKKASNGSGLLGKVTDALITGLDRSFEGLYVILDELSHTDLTKPMDAISYFLDGFKLMLSSLSDTFNFDFKNFIESITVLQEKLTSFAVAHAKMAENADKYMSSLLNMGYGASIGVKVAEIERKGVQEAAARFISGDGEEAVKEKIQQKEHGLISVHTQEDLEQGKMTEDQRIATNDAAIREAVKNSNSGYVYVVEDNKATGELAHAMVFSQDEEGNLIVDEIRPDGNTMTNKRMSYEELLQSNFGLATHLEMMPINFDDSTQKDAFEKRLREGTADGLKYGIENESGSICSTPVANALGVDPATNGWNTVTPRMLLGLLMGREKLRSEGKDPSQAVPKDYTTLTNEGPDRATPASDMRTLLENQRQQDQRLSEERNSLLRDVITEIDNSNSVTSNERAGGISQRIETTTGLLENINKSFGKFSYLVTQSKALFNSVLEIGTSMRGIFKEGGISGAILNTPGHSVDMFSSLLKGVQSFQNLMHQTGMKNPLTGEVFKSAHTDRYKTISDIFKGFTDFMLRNQQNNPTLNNKELQDKLDRYYAEYYSLPEEQRPGKLQHEQRLKEIYESSTPRGVAGDIGHTRSPMPDKEKMDPSNQPYEPPGDPYARLEGVVNQLPEKQKAAFIAVYETMEDRIGSKSSSSAALERRINAALDASYKVANQGISSFSMEEDYHKFWKNRQLAKRMQDTDKYQRDLSKIDDRMRDMSKSGVPSYYRLKRPNSHLYRVKDFESMADELREDYSGKLYPQSKSAAQSHIDSLTGDSMLRSQAMTMFVKQYLAGTVFSSDLASPDTLAMLTKPEMVKMLNKLLPGKSKDELDNLASAGWNVDFKGYGITAIDPESRLNKVSLLVHEMTHSITKKFLSKFGKDALDAIDFGGSSFDLASSLKEMRTSGLEDSAKRVDEIIDRQGLNLSNPLRDSKTGKVSGAAGEYLYSVEEAFSYVAESILSKNKDLETLYRGVYGDQVFDAIKNTLEKIDHNTFSEQGIREFKSNFDELENSLKLIAKDPALFMARLSAGIRHRVEPPEPNTGTTSNLSQLSDSQRMYAGIYKMVSASGNDGLAQLFKTLGTNKIFGNAFVDTLHSSVIQVANMANGAAKVDPKIATELFNIFSAGRNNVQSMMIDGLSSMYQPLMEKVGRLLSDPSDANLSELFAVLGKLPDTLKKEVSANLMSYVSGIEDSVKEDLRSVMVDSNMGKIPSLLRGLVTTGDLGKVAGLGFFDRMTKGSLPPIGFGIPGITTDASKIPDWVLRYVGSSMSPRNIDNKAVFDEAGSFYSKQSGVVLRGGKDFKVDSNFDLDEGVTKLSISAKDAAGNIVNLTGKLNEFGDVEIDKTKKEGMFDDIKRRLIMESPQELFEEVIEEIIFGLMELFRNIVSIQSELAEIGTVIGQENIGGRKARTEFLYQSIKAATASAQPFKEAVETNIQNLKIMGTISDPESRMAASSKLTRTQLGAQTVFGISLEQSMEAIPAIYAQVRDRMSETIKDPAEAASAAVGELESTMSKFVVAQRESGVAGEDLVQVYSQLASTAKDVGMGIPDELLAFTAATSVKLNKPAQETANTIRLVQERVYGEGAGRLATLGISTQQFNKDTGVIENRSFIDILKDIKSLSLERPELSKQLAQAAGGRAYSVDVSKMLTSLEDYDRILEKQKSSTGGEFEEKLDRNKNNFEGAINTLQSSFGQFIAMTIFETGVIDKVTQAMTGLGDVFNHISRIIKDSPNIGGVLFQGVNLAITAFVYGLTRGINTLSGLAGVINKTSKFASSFAQSYMYAADSVQNSDTTAQKLVKTLLLMGKEGPKSIQAVVGSFNQLASAATRAYMATGGGAVPGTPTSRRENDTSKQSGDRSGMPVRGLIYPTTQPIPMSGMPVKNLTLPPTQPQPIPMSGMPAQKLPTLVANIAIPGSNMPVQKLTDNGGALPDVEQVAAEIDEEYKENLEEARRSTNQSTYKPLHQSESDLIKSVNRGRLIPHKHSTATNENLRDSYTSIEEGLSFYDERKETSSRVKLYAGDTESTDMSGKRRYTTEDLESERAKLSAEKTSKSIASLREEVYGLGKETDNTTKSTAKSSKKLFDFNTLFQKFSAFGEGYTSGGKPGISGFWDTKPGQMTKRFGSTTGTLAAPLAFDALMGGFGKDNLINMGVGIAGGFIGSVAGPEGTIIGYTIAKSISEYIDVPGMVSTSGKERERFADSLIGIMAVSVEDEDKSERQKDVEEEAKRIRDLARRNAKLELMNSSLGVSDFQRDFLSINKGVGRSRSSVSSSDYKNYMEYLETGDSNLTGQISNFAGKGKELEILRGLFSRDEYADLEKLFVESKISNIQELLEMISSAADAESKLGKEVESVLSTSQEVNSVIDSMASGTSNVINITETYQQLLERVALIMSDIKDKQSSMYDVPVGLETFGTFGAGTLSTRMSFMDKFSQISSGEITGEEADAIMEQYNQSMAIRQGLPDIMRIAKPLSGVLGQNYNDIIRDLGAIGPEGQSQFSSMIQPLVEQSNFVEQYEGLMDQREAILESPHYISGTGEGYEAASKELEAIEKQIFLSKEKYSIAKRYLEQIRKNPSILQNELELLKMQSSARREMALQAEQEKEKPRFVAPSIMDTEGYSSSDLSAAIDYAMNKQSDLTAMFPEWGDEFAKEQFLMQAGDQYKPVSGISQSFVNEYLKQAKDAENKKKQASKPNTVDLRDLSDQEYQSTISRAWQLQNQAVGLVPELAGEYEDERLLLMRKNNDIMLELGLSQEYLRMAMDENTEVTEEGLRGHYNLPGNYRMPTIWDYYNEGGKETGEVNFPGVPKDEASLEYAKLLAQKMVDSQNSVNVDVEIPDLSNLGNLLRGSAPMGYPDPVESSSSTLPAGYYDPIPISDEEIASYQSMVAMDRANSFFLDKMGQMGFGPRRESNPMSEEMSQANTDYADVLATMKVNYRSVADRFSLIGEGKPKAEVTNEDIIRSARSKSSFDATPIAGLIAKPMDDILRWVAPTPEGKSSTPIRDHLEFGARTLNYIQSEETFNNIGKLFEYASFMGDKHKLRKSRARKMNPDATVPDVVENEALLPKIVGFLLGGTSKAKASGGPGLYEELEEFDSSKLESSADGLTSSNENLTSSFQRTRDDVMSFAERVYLASSRSDEFGNKVSGSADEVSASSNRTKSAFDELSNSLDSSSFSAFSSGMERMSAAVNIFAAKLESLDPTRPFKNVKTVIVKADRVDVQGSGVNSGNASAGMGNGAVVSRGTDNSGRTTLRAGPSVGNRNRI